MSVEHLLLPLGEKVLRLAVVQAVPLSRHRLYDPVFLESLPVGRPLVLPALVGMQDPVSCPWELSVQPGKHVQNHLPVRALRERIGKDPVVVEIDDRGEIGLAPGALEFRDVRPRLPEAGIGMEVSSEYVRCRLADLPSVGAVSLVVAAEDRMYALRVHQSEYFLVVDPFRIPRLQSDEDLAVSVSLLRPQPYRLDFLPDAQIVRVFGLFRAFQGVFVGGLRQSRDGQRFLQGYFPSVFLALDDFPDDPRFLLCSEILFFSAKACAFFLYSSSNSSSAT